jgi:methylenetetrahydrofolate reductase (NADPH)
MFVYQVPKWSSNVTALLKRVSVEADYLQDAGNKILSMKNRLRETLESGSFTVTAEITPPRGADFDSLDRAAEILRPAVSAVNLTDGAGARVRMSSLAAAIHLKQAGIEPILQVTCRDRNRIAIQSDLLGAAAFGIRNVLALTGDKVDAGDDKDAKAVFDLSSGGLLTVLRTMSESGTTMTGVELSTAADFFPAAAVAPHDPADDWTPDGLIEKHAAGARFVQTQYCYDMDVLKRYMQRLADHGVTEKLYFIVGLGPLRSAKGALWMRDNLFGTIIPDNIIRQMENARDPLDEGIRICADLMQQARDIDGVSGVHLMAPSLHKEMVAAVKMAGLMP